MKLRCLIIPFLVAIIPGCGLIPGTGGSGAGGSASSATATSSTGATVAAQGSSCGVDPNTGITLCLGLSLCPNLVINQGAYPGCGFRVNGGAIDIECSCSGQVCPLGAASTCDEAATLMAQQNEGAVCAQVSASKCTAGTSMTTSTSSTGTGCDTACRDACAGEPNCVQQCGC